jgi:hypothetical protein
MKEFPRPQSSVNKLKVLFVAVAWGLKLMMISVVTVSKQNSFPARRSNASVLIKKAKQVE